MNASVTGGAWPTLNLPNTVSAAQNNKVSDGSRYGWLNSQPAAPPESGRLPPRDGSVPGR
jgi:hypothetical protein